MLALSFAATNWASHPSPPSRSAWSRWWTTHSALRSRRGAERSPRRSRWAPFTSAGPGSWTDG